MNMKSKQYPKKNNLNNLGNILKCSKCGYEWETNSKMEWATCPSCRLKVKNQLKDKQTNQEFKGEEVVKV